MASYLQESLDKDLNVDTVLEQYMQDLENCTTDLSQAPPILGGLTTVSNLQQRSGTAAGLYDPFDPSASSPLDLQKLDLPMQASGHSADPSLDLGTKRTQAWTAKNRRAQKRFRERQKAQKEQVAEQLAAMAAQMEQLKVDNSRMASRNITLEKVLVFREGEIAELQDQNCILDAEPQAAPSPLSLTSTPQQPLPVSSRMVQIIQEYRSIVNVMASLLLRLDKEGVTAEIADQLATSGRQSGQLAMRTAVLSPECIIVLMQVNMDQRHTQLESMLDDKSSNTTEHWQQVMDMLDLEASQKRDMLNLHTRFLQRLQDNRETRRNICLGLQQGTDKVKKLHAVVATEAQKYVASMFEVHSEVQQLRDNLREQHRVWTDFYSTVNGVFSPVQYCRLVVHSFPMWPDILAICTCLAKSESEHAEGSSEQIQADNL
ncbi:TPA: hypothetical protein ACH3X3_007993 [Trebouxia sp. C0006]